MKNIEKVFNNMEYGPAPENDDAVRAWLESHKKGFKHYINGKWVAPASKKYFDSTNPATGKQLARIAKGNQKDIDTAVNAAHRAHTKWAKLSGHERGSLFICVGTSGTKKITSIGRVGISG